MVQLDLKKLFDNVGEAIFFSHDLDLGEVKQWERRPFTTPVHVEGKAENRAGIVTLTCQVRCTLDCVCDLCLKPFQQQKNWTFSHTVVRKLNQLENDDYLVAEDGIVDLCELITADIVLELPMKVQCSEDCKGLCPYCGADRNVVDCGCTSDWVDPQREVFKKLLDSF